MGDRPVAFVTGSRTGLGRALAEDFLRRGYAVEGCSRSPAEWTADGYVHHEADVTDESAVTRLVLDIARRHDRLDVAVNNAGGASMNHMLLTPVATLDRLLATHVRGTFLVSRECAKVMQHRKSGRIVNISSVAVPLRLEGEAAYGTAKAAVEHLTRVMAREFAPFGITCNAVAPAPTDTALLRGVPPHKIEDILARLALHRMGRPEDVVHVVAFLTQPASACITGQVIYLGGA